MRGFALSILQKKRRSLQMRMFFATRRGVKLARLADIAFKLVFISQTGKLICSIAPMFVYKCFFNR